MISTLFFMHLIGFLLWHLTSKQTNLTKPLKYLKPVLAHKQASRWAGAALIILATALFIAKWGWMTGICASVVGLMAAGSLIVVLHPFNFIKGRVLILLFLLFQVLEIFI